MPRPSAAQSSRLRSKRALRQPTQRLPALPLQSLNPAQQAIVDAINAGPRGHFSNAGPFAAFLYAPAFGMLAQELGGHVRYRTSVPPRLSETAILCTARYWKAQYEWHAHARIALKQGVTEATIRDLHAGRAPKSAPRDEQAINVFVKELYTKRRVSDAIYARVHKLLGDAGMVELVGILGYYAMIAMILNVFRMPVPDGAAPPFKEPT